MVAAVPCAVDEQLRVEALRAAVAVVGGRNVADMLNGDVAAVLALAEQFEDWLLRAGN